MLRKSSLVAVFCIAFSDIITGMNIIPRSEWGARDATKFPGNFAAAPPYVIIHHSASGSCTTKTKCISLVKSFQNYHMDTHKWKDIGYNFLVGEDGNIYEGRGWDVIGTHAPNYNSKSIGICVIGTFTNSLPNEKAQDALKELINYGIQNNKITKNYKLIGHRQVRATECPGRTFYNLIKTWDHYASTP